MQLAYEKLGVFESPREGGSKFRGVRQIYEALNTTSVNDWYHQLGLAADGSWCVQLYCFYATIPWS